jgi:hypothetical protein
VSHVCKYYAVATEPEKEVMCYSTTNDCYSICTLSVDSVRNSTLKHTYDTEATVAMHAGHNHADAC